MAFKNLCRPSILTLSFLLMNNVAHAHSGIPVTIPASQRIGENGKIGSANPQPGAVGVYAGLCAKWGKQNLQQSIYLLNSETQATRLLDNVPPDATNPAVPEPLAGDQSSDFRKGRFFARAPVLDFETFDYEGLHSPSRTMPWEEFTCRLQGTLNQAPNITSLGPSLAARFRGNLHIPAPGTYTFIIRSDDGYQLLIGGQEVGLFQGDRPSKVDSRRAIFNEDGVYPIDLVYYDKGGGAAFEVLLATGDACFGSGPDFALQLPCSTGIDLDSDTFSGVLPASIFQVLDYHRVDLPTWVTASSDPAFTVADESCAVEQADQTCGALATQSCGNGIRERVNTGTLGAPTFADEACDDGNLVNGDGCSSTCTTETNFTCGNGPISTCTLPMPTVLTPGHDETIDSINPTYSGNVPGLTSATGYFIDLNLDGSLIAGCTGLALSEGNEGVFSCTPATPILSPGSHSVFAILRFGATSLTPGEDNIFTVALTPPNTTIESGPSETVSSSNAAFTFSSNQSPVTFECKVDDASGFSACTSPAQLSGLVAGVHTFSVRAVSSVSGVDSTAATRSWTVSLPPGAPAIAQPVDGKAINTARPEYVGTAPASATIHVYLDNATMPSCTVSANASGEFRCMAPGPLMDGVHSVVAKSVNSVGIESAASSINSFAVDTVVPVLSLMGPAGSTTERRPALEGMTEPGTAVRVYLDEGIQPVCTLVSSVAGAFRCVPSTDLMVGSHQFTAEAEDSAGNVSVRPAAQSFLIVDTAPQEKALMITEPSEGAVTSPRPRASGIGQPGSEIDIFMSGEKICRTLVDASGSWSCNVEVDLPRGSHVVVARVVMPSQSSNAGEISVRFSVSAGEAHSLSVGCGCASGKDGMWSLLAMVVLLLRRRR